MQPAQGGSNHRKSNIPLARLSRSNARPSNLSAQKPSRSSSVNRLGKPLQLFPFKRSASYTNLRGEVSTPDCRLSVNRCSTTPRSQFVNRYPVNDKQWQSTQLARVKKFFLDLDPEMPPLKPLNLRLFLHTMNLLLSKLDNRINITAEDYKEKIPSYMSLLKYPIQIKASVLKNPGVPSSWSYIFAMWVWLIDLLTWLESADTHLVPSVGNLIDYQLNQRFVQYMKTKYSLWNNAQDETQSDKDFESDIGRILNVDLDEVECSKLAIKALEQQKNELESSLNNIRSEAQVETEKLTLLQKKNAARAMQVQKRKEDLQTRKAQALGHKEALLKLIEEKSENNRRLMDVIQKQSCSYEKKCELKDHATELENLCALKWKQKEERLQGVSKYDMQTSDIRQRVQEKICAVNSEISKHTMRPELATLKIRETRLHQADMIDEVKLFLKGKKEFDVKLQEEEENLLRKTEQAEAHKKEIAEVHVELEKKVSKLSEEKQKVVEELSLIRSNAKVDVENMEGEEQQMNALIAEIKTERPNMDEIVGKLQRAIKRKEDLSAEQKKYVEKGEEFFKNIFHTTVKSIGAQKEMQKQITYEVNEVVRRVTNFTVEAERELDEYLKKRENK